jgi:hypothetical protein
VALRLGGATEFLAYVFEDIGDGAAHARREVVLQPLGG